MIKQHYLYRLLLPLLLALAICLSSCDIPSAGNSRDTQPAETSASSETVASDESGTTPEAESETASETASDAASESESEFLGCKHTDTDDDGLCDICYVSVLTDVVFFAMNDLHGKFCDTDKQPGVDELTTYLKTAYATYDHVILLSSGDMWQGSSESNLTKGLILTEWMNELDFTAMTLGNHEFDWGESFIEANAAVAEFPFLAINIYDRDTGALADYCQPSVYVDLGALQVGIIGAIGDCYSSISGETSGGVYFKTGSELTALVKAESTRLREAGADLIIYSLHDGYADSRKNGVLLDSQLNGYYDPSLSEGFVDLVFEGHTHKNYVLPDGDGVYHLQNGGENRGISQVTIAYNTANGNHYVDSATVVESSIYGAVASDPIVDRLMEKYADDVSAGTEVLGYNVRYRSGDELRELVAQLYYETGMVAWGEQYKIVLGGGFLSVRSPYALPQGNVTYSNLQMLMPFDNALVLCSVQGRDLLTKFIHTDNKNYFNYYGEYGESVKNEIDPNATYYVVVDTYTSTYAPNRLTEIARYDATTFARDLLAAHIRGGGMA